MTVLDAVLLVAGLLLLVWALSERAMRASEKDDTAGAREAVDYWRRECGSWRQSAIDLEAQRKQLLKRVR